MSVWTKAELLTWFEAKAEQAFGELMYSCVSGNWYCSMEDPATEIAAEDRTTFLMVSAGCLLDVLTKLRAQYEERLVLLTPEERLNPHSLRGMQKKRAVG